ncbi:hypothetical protein [Kitasatospora sp. NPDC092286]|uniref:hypothetical protein n=1 Tax=Kitasatospora sp. NPDC092286 TaxID=3364087 RepID=UPI00382AAB35
MTTKTRRAFLLSRDCEDDAWSTAFRLGAALAGYSVTERYGIAVRRLSGRGVDGPAWGLYLVDRTPTKPYPAELVFTTVRGRRRTLLPELVALAA